MPDFSYIGIMEAHLLFIARPHNERTSRIYLGAGGPKFLIPTTYADEAKKWWLERMGLVGPQPRWNWRTWFLVSFFIPVYFALYVDMRYGGPLFLLIILALAWLRRHGRSRIRQDFERKFPSAKFVSGRVARNLRIASVSMPRWCQIFLAVFGIWHTIDSKSYTEILEISDFWLSTVNAFIIHTVFVLFGIWGLYGVIIHTNFRRRFKRRSTKEDFTANIDWFDGLNSVEQPVN